MRLPACEDMGGEPHDPMGFCPVEYHVPCEDDERSTEETRLYVDCGFVAGCVWGDDVGYKIQYLDLSRAREGHLIRDERFGYIRLPEKVRLAEAISTYLYDPTPDGPGQRIAIAVERHFDVLSGRDDSDG
jgi:hypothetical protein